MAETTYQCPGEAHPISRGIHLGRLATFYPPCRQCPSRDDTGTLSRAQIKRLVETRHRGVPRALFTEEAASGVYLNDLAPETARKLGAAAGVCFGERPAGVSYATIVLAGDGRAIGPDLVAAAGEGLRWAGCRVVDIGEATAACLSLAVARLEAQGGMLVGNPQSEPHAIGLTFWGPGGVPCSAGGGLDAVRQAFERHVDRPTRAFGPVGRFQADAPYLAGLADSYHALRPLRFVLDTACRPLVRYLARLTQSVACQIEHAPGALRSFVDGGKEPGQNRLSHLIGDSSRQFHFGAWIDSDGEVCRLVDERGMTVAPERLLVLLASHVLAQQPGAPIALEAGISPATLGRIADAGGRPVAGGATTREEMARAVRDSGAALGGGPSGRYVFANGPPAADALRVLTLVLTILSQSDRPLSEVLDQTGPGE
ncbi:MAG: hypothetical protein ACYC35_15840 [Pirellulales bacterium]